MMAALSAARILLIMSYEKCLRRTARILLFIGRQSLGHIFFACRAKCLPILVFHRLTIHQQGSAGGVLARAGIPGKILFQRGATDITTSQHDAVVVSAAKWASEGLRHNFEIKKSNGESEVLGFLGESVSGQTGAFVALLDL